MRVRTSLHDMDQRFASCRCKAEPSRHLAIAGALDLRFPPIMRFVVKPLSTALSCFSAALAEVGRTFEQAVIGGRHGLRR